MLNKKYGYGRQTIEDDDIKAVVDVLKSDWLTQGPEVKKFEDALCLRFAAEHATALSNGTAGLHLAALALGWEEGDTVLTTPITFVASANCALYGGGIPDFVDIDPQTYTIDVDKLEAKVRLLKEQGKRVSGVVAVDFAGHPCEWESLRWLANKYDFTLIDDACHALGARYHNEELCGAKYADLTVLSFHPVKHVTTGEGGAVLTHSGELDEKIKTLRTHGITQNKVLMQGGDGPWYYEMQNLGYNYRITDIQCALGVSQLKKLDRFIGRRRTIAEYYRSIFNGDERVTLPCENGKVFHVYHLYPVQIDFKTLKITKAVFFQRLAAKNIFCQVHYIPVHLQPYYRNHFGFKKGDFPIAEEFYNREVSIPIYPSLEQEDLDYISTTIKGLVA